MAYMKDTLGVGGTSDTFLLVGNCDIWVTNLTTGSVKLQVAFPEAPTTWVDVPSGSYTANTFTSIFISEHGIRGRFVGVTNNADVYVRLGRHLNG